MGARALRVSDGTKTYERHGRAGAVFQAVDPAVEVGEIFALLGPSGCGKSTLLRVIAGLEPLTHGQIASDLPARKIGMVFQEPLLLPWLTVAQNVALGLRYAANREARTPGAVEHLLYDFGLASVADAYPESLSGGQAQRASLARTLVTRPSILLLDEPFSSLDPRTRATLQDWLLEVVRQRDLTVVVVTHDIDEALYLGDRVGLMTSHPGTIARTWPLHHTHRGGLARRGEVSIEIRREILERYQADVPAEPADANWVI